MSLPKVTEDGIGGYLFDWQDEGIKIQANRLKVHGDGRVIGEIVVLASKEGIKHPHLHQAQFNFSSTTSRERLARSLEGRYGEVDWHTILEQLCVYTLERVRQGEPVLTMWSNNGYQPPQFLLEPLIIQDYPVVIYGDPSSFKSGMGLYVYAALLLPWTDNPLGLTPQAKSVNGLYLDWEADDKTTRWQLTRLERGMALPPMPLVYRRCSVPLCQDIEAVRKAVTDNGSEVVIIDSLGLACGGELKEAAPAIAFFAALRQLRVSSLILAHPAKNPEIKRKTIYGSVFFEAQVRSAWEIRKIQEIGDDQIDVALYHRKPPPFDKIQPPIGLNARFTRDTIEISRQEVKSVREFIAGLGTQAQIESLLSHGPLTKDELAEDLDASKASIDMAITRLKKKDKVVRLDTGAYGLKANTITGLTGC